MKKFSRILALLLVALMVFATVGCASQTQTITSEVWDDDQGGEQNPSDQNQSQGDNSQAGDTPSNGGQQQTGNIDMKGYTVVITAWSTTSGKPEATSKTYKQEMAEFESLEKKYNCKFDWFGIYDSLQYYSTFCTQTLAGTKFGDIVPVPGDQGFPSAALNGYARCLDNYFDWNSEIFVDRYVNDALLLKGKHYYLANSQSINANAGSGIAFKKSLFKKFGVNDPHYYTKNNNWTWDTFEDLCKTMTRVDAGQQYYGYYGIPKFFVANNVQEVIKLDEGKYKFNLNSPAGIETVAWAKKLWDAGYCTKTASLWEAGLVAMGSTSWYGLTAQEDIGWVPYPIGPSADGKYVNFGGAMGLTIIPTTVKDAQVQGVAAIISDLWKIQDWEATPEDKLAERHSDEYSYQLQYEHMQRASTSNIWVTYYPTMYRNVVWSNYGIDDGKEPQEFFAAVEDQAQQEIDALWALLDQLE